VNITNFLDKKYLARHEHNMDFRSERITFLYDLDRTDKIIIFVHMNLNVGFVQQFTANINQSSIIRQVETGWTKS
jgi:hypothetical protein